MDGGESGQVSDSEPVVLGKPFYVVGPGSAASKLTTAICICISWSPPHRRRESYTFQCRINGLQQLIGSIIFPLRFLHRGATEILLKDPSNPLKEVFTGCC